MSKLTVADLLDFFTARKVKKENPAKKKQEAQQCAPAKAHLSPRYADGTLRKSGYPKMLNLQQGSAVLANGECWPPPLLLSPAHSIQLPTVGLLVAEYRDSGRAD